MDENNPYRTPESDVLVAGSETEQLAGRGERLLAVIIDGLIGIAVMMPILYLIGYFDYMFEGLQPPVWMMIVSVVLGFVLYIAVHFKFIQANGQTIGKKLLNIRIENKSGGVASFNTIIFKRYLFMSVLSIIPFLGSLLAIVNFAFIFRKNRRCLHDEVASTQVMKCS